MFIFKKMAANTVTGSASCTFFPCILDEGTGRPVKINRSPLVTIGKLCFFLLIRILKKITDLKKNANVLPLQSCQVSRNSRVTHANPCFHTLTRQWIKISRELVKISLFRTRPACPLTNLFEGTCTPRGWILGVQGIF